MSYAVSGKIAGLGRYNYGYGFRGLGDAAYDAAMAAYTQDHALWVQQKAAYDNAVAAFQGQSAGQASSYAMGMSAYQRDLAAWQQEQAARTAIILANQSQQLQTIRAQNAALAAAKAAGVTNGTCITQAQKNAYQADCSFQSATVKGLGAPSGPSCALALLPVCVPSPTAPPPLRPQPVPPAAPPALAPPSPLRPEPQPPAQASAPPPVTATPSPSPSAPTPAPIQNSPLGPDPSTTASLTPVPPQITPAPSKSAGLIKNGLILLVVAGGGYALYRTFKKPRAA